MKKLLIYIFAVVALCAVSCSKDDEEDDIKDVTALINERKHDSIPKEEFGVTTNPPARESNRGKTKYPRLPKKDSSRTFIQGAESEQVREVDF